MGRPEHDAAGLGDGLKDRRFVTIYDFMCVELGLKGTDLLVYGRIFGFARYGKTFYESKQSTAALLGVTRRAVFDAVRRLKECGLIEESSPCEESERIGSKCYRPAPGPLSSIGIELPGYEGSAYEGSSPYEEPSPPAAPAGEAASPLPGAGYEAPSPEEVNEVHPIRKTDNRHFR